jgi:hypothetical protein
MSPRNSDRQNNIKYSDKRSKENFTYFFFCFVQKN